MLSPMVFWTTVLVKLFSATVSAWDVDVLLLARCAGLATSLSVFLCLNRKI